MINLSSTRTPRSLSWVSSKPVLMHGVVSPQVEDPALALVEPHQVPLRVSLCTCPRERLMQALVSHLSVQGWVRHLTPFLWSDRNTWPHTTFMRLASDRTPFLGA